MFSEELKALRSNFLVHWTGRDLEEKYPFHSEAKHAEYLHRLIGTLREGLWMKDQPIELYDESSSHTKRFLWPATCFTEIKLSQTKKHTERYGCLGFGFTRQFVMDRYGAPVLYVPGDKECDRDSGRHRNLDTISPHLLNLYEELGSLASRTQLQEFYTLRASAATVAIFIKKMSDKDTHKFELLDEAEWRIPYTTKPNPCIKPPIDYLVPYSDLELSRQEPEREPKAKILFCPDDLKVLIFPDDCTRRMASNDEFFQCWLKRRDGFPIMATVEECTQF